MSELPAGPGWYEDEHDPLLLRYFDGVVWTSHTTPRRSPTADASTIGRATPGVIPGRAGNPGAWAQPGQPGAADAAGPGPVAGRRGSADRLQPLPAGLGRGAQRRAARRGRARRVVATAGRPHPRPHRDHRADPGVRVPVARHRCLGDVRLHAGGAARGGVGGPAARPDGVRRADPLGVRADRTGQRAGVARLPDDLPDDPRGDPREDGRRHGRAPGRSSRRS